MDKNKFKELQKILGTLPQGPMAIPSASPTPSPAMEEQLSEISINPEQLQMQNEQIQMGGYEQPTEVDEELKKKVLQRLIEKQNQKLNFVPGEQ